MSENELKAGTEPPLMQREEAYFALERLIVTGELAPGTWVSETDLMIAAPLSDLQCSDCRTRGLFTRFPDAVPKSAQ